MIFSKLGVIFVLALTQNIDDFLSGMAFGISRTLFSSRKLLPFMLGSTLAMLVAMELGHFFSKIFSQMLTNYVSALLLVGLGLRMIWKTCFLGSKCDDNQELPDLKKDLTGFWVLFMLGMALGIDDVVEAVGLSMAKFPVFLTVLIFKTVQLIAVFSGSLLGYLGLSKINPPKLDLIPGIIIIFLGLKQLFLGNC